MAAITANSRNVTAPTVMTKFTLTASDTITFKPSVSQALYLYNTTAGDLTALVDGSGGTTISPKGFGGTIDVSAGKSIPVVAGSVVLVDLQSISAFCQGATVTITGAAGLTAWLVEG